jgi:hypothetical protein
MFLVLANFVDKNVYYVRIYFDACINGFHISFLEKYHQHIAVAYCG